MPILVISSESLTCSGSYAKWEKRPIALMNGNPVSKYVKFASTIKPFELVITGIWACRDYLGME